MGNPERASFGRGERGTKAGTWLPTGPRFPFPVVMPAAVGAQAEKLLPHPHPPEAFGLWKVNPEPCIDVV